jgi:hypothetical protein
MVRGPQACCLRAPWLMVELNFRRSDGAGALLTAKLTVAVQPPPLVKREAAHGLRANLTEGSHPVQLRYRRLLRAEG